MANLRCKCRGIRIIILRPQSKSTHFSATNEPLDQIITMIYQVPSVSLKY